MFSSIILLCSHVLTSLLPFLPLLFPFLSKIHSRRKRHSKVLRAQVMTRLSQNLASPAIRGEAGLPFVMVSGVYQPSDQFLSLSTLSLSLSLSTISVLFTSCVCFHSSLFLSALFFLASISFSLSILSVSVSVPVPISFSRCILSLSL